MAILAVHYPFHYKSCGFFKLALGLGAQLRLLRLKLSGKTACCVHCFFVSLPPQLGKLILGLDTGRLNGCFACRLSVGFHLPGLGLGLRNGGLRVGFCLCYAGNSLK